MPGARGHRNEAGPKKILGKVTISPKVIREHRKKKSPYGPPLKPAPPLKKAKMKRGIRRRY